MASDRRQFAAALNRWERLHSNAVRSASWIEGITAIVVSGFTDAEPGTTAARRELCRFEHQAVELANRTDMAGGSATIHRAVGHETIDEVVQDDAVASVIFIGNGSLSKLLLGERYYYTWSDVSGAADHLKRGWCMQRQSGGLTGRLNVPLGLFMLEAPEHLIAAPGTGFSPMSLDDLSNECLTSVMTGYQLEYATFVAGKGDFARPVAAEGFDWDLTGTFRRRMVQVSDAYEGNGDREAIELFRTCEERLGLDIEDFLVRHAGLLSEATSGSETALREAYERLAAMSPNARFFLRP